MDISASSTRTFSAPGGRAALRALGLAGALGGLAQALTGSAAALLAGRIGESDAVAGVPQSLLVAGGAIAALALSRLTRGYGRRFALGTGAVVATAGFLVVAGAALTASLAGVFVGSLLMGAGNTVVMLGRYAAADLGPESSRARSMSTVLVATTIGAVVGPNLLAPTGYWSVQLGMPELVGPFLVAVLASAASVVVLLCGLGSTPVPPAADGPERPAARGAFRFDASTIRGLTVLGLTNLVMTGLMTMAPVHLQHMGTSLTVIGVIVSAHIIGMFAPSPISGRLVDRFGPGPVVAAACAVLVCSALLVATSGESSSVWLWTGLVLLGVGWNLGLVSGSVLITAGVPARERPRREGWGEVAMGATAMSGGVSSGAVVAASSYPALAVVAVVASVLIVPCIGNLLRDASRDRAVSS